MTARGFVIFIGATAVMLTLPLLAVLGTFVLWWLLLFIIPVVAGTWYAIMRNKRDNTVLETLTLAPERITLTQSRPKQPPKTWEANPYWVTVHLRELGGPVDNYLTLKGADREVELGAFLSAEERAALYGEMKARLRPFQP